MKFNIIPKTKSGKWSVGLIVAMFALFIAGTSFVNLLYGSTPGGDTIWEDLAGRPALVLVVIAGMISGILAFIAGIIAIVKQKERALLVYVAIILSTLLVSLILGELVFPH